MHRWHRLALVLLCTGVFAEETVEEEWAVMRMVGRDVGYVHARVRTTPEVVETTVATSMTIRRLGVDVSISQEQVSVERADDGRLVRMRSAMKMSANEMATDVTFADGKAHVVRTVMGSRRESTVSCPDGAVGLHHIERRVQQTGLEPGATVEVDTFSPDIGGAARVTVTVVGPEETELLDGEKRMLTRVETRVDKLPFTVVTWLDAEGKTLKTLVPVAGLEIEAIVTTKERALAAAKGKEELPPDVFKRMLIVAKHPVPYPRRLDAALLRIEAEGSLPELAHGTQVLERTTDDGAVLLRIRRAVPARGGIRPLAEPPAELAQSLAPNSMIQSDAPEIVRIAQDVVIDEPDAWRAAQKLERWVHEGVTEKSLGVGFASALEVCRDREGDCTEHAVLLCALCRAAGIPARVAMGLEYLGGVWAGHAWNEVWIEGEWYPLDATNGRGSVDPLHLTLGTMTLADSDMGREFMSVANWIGKLSIDVVEVTHRGHVLQPGREDAVAIEGDRYVNRLWGLALTRPEGFAFDRETPDRISTRLLELDGRTATGQKVEIEIDARDAPAAVDWTRLLARRGVPNAREVTIDDRPGRRGTRQRDGRRQVVVLVLAGDALFIFKLDRVETFDDLRAFDAFLASVDFDVAVPK
ncbi:MAG: transglutaminase domain-containing protein [Planctomycetota bacterium]|jgi:hypothetical protein